MSKLKEYPHRVVIYFNNKADYMNYYYYTTFKDCVIWLFDNIGIGGLKNNDCKNHYIFTIHRSSASDLDINKLINEIIYKNDQKWHMKKSFHAYDDHTKVRLYFKNHSDAIRFKLIWGGKHG